MKQFIQKKHLGEKLDAHRMSRKDKITAESFKKQAEREESHE